MKKYPTKFKNNNLTEIDESLENSHDQDLSSSRQRKQIRPQKKRNNFLSDEGQNVSQKYLKDHQKKQTDKILIDDPNSSENNIDPQATLKIQ